MPALSKPFTFIINTSSFTATSVGIPSTVVSPQNNTHFISLKEKGDGYYGGSEGIHTVTYTITPNFIGTLTVQATLATNPTENDWFTVNDSTSTHTLVINPVTSTTTSYVNFTGNFVWIRSSVHRSVDAPNGAILYINYNH